ncbi:HpcH/HpaI aldolase/citrate lyase family protein [Nocardia carnea]|uniref:HpcH/HpaI aldolase/citrate lyase family protein n=1 Tax=Nocardia carnea TaxID=37328 RepID=UPI00245404F6|nr:CoA ester lyase [Nocardia carnea]
MRDLRTAATFLFVPGDRPDRFDRAAESGADVIIIDLEDAVAPTNRPAARNYVRSWLKTGGRAIVRLNPRGTADHSLDLRALQSLVGYVMLPKVETAAQAEATVAALGIRTRVVALIETARGVQAADTIAASEVVLRLAFGNVDLAMDLGIEPNNREALLSARSLITLASASAGLHGPIDGVTTALNDLDSVQSDARYSASLGFRGKLCIHPRQLHATRIGLAPTQTEVDWAREILKGSFGGQARSVGGAMVDRPVEERARDILRRAEGW